MLKDSDNLYLKLMQSLFKGKQSLIPTFEKYGLTSLQAYLLILLSADDGTPMNALAHYLHCDASNITILTDKLVGSDLIKRVEDPADRRYKLVFLTKKGEKLKKQICTDIEKVKQKSLEKNNLTDSQLEDAIKTINSFFS